MTKDEEQIIQELEAKLYVVTGAVKHTPEAGEPIYLNFSLELYAHSALDALDDFLSKGLYDRTQMTNVRAAKISN